MRNCGVVLQVQAVLYNNEKDALKIAMDSLKKAIQVYAKQTGEKTDIILLHGDASQEPVYCDEEIEKIKRKYESVFSYHYQHFGFNAGFSKGHNLLAHHAKAKYLLINNPDIVLSPRFLLKTLEVFKRDKKREIGIIEGRQTPLEHPKEYDTKTGETAWCSGACMMVPTAIYRKLRGFDDKTFFMYCEDVDFSWRVKALGKKLIYQPLAPVFHAKRLDERAAMKPTDTEIYRSAESAMLLAYKWSNKEYAEAIYRNYINSPDPVYRNAAKEYAMKKEQGMLPKPLDPEHKVAVFLKGNYAKHRFIL